MKTLDFLEKIKDSEEVLFRMKLIDKGRTCRWHILRDRVTSYV